MYVANVCTVVLFCSLHACGFDSRQMQSCVLPFAAHLVLSSLGQIVNGKKTTLQISVTVYIRPGKKPLEISGTQFT